MNRLLGGFARRIDTPWKMYPVGVLFGLGFDTATEVALLVLSGTAVASGLPFYAILSLPVLFAAGMCLFDTLDGCFMNFAYGWAFSKTDPQGVLQHHHHGALGRRRLRHRDDRARRAARRPSSTCTARFWDTMANFNINTGRVRHRRPCSSSPGWSRLAIWRFGHIESRWDRSADLARSERALALRLERGLESVDA